MPEFPDVELYVEHLRRRLLDKPVAGVRVANPFLVRTVTPPPSALVGQRVEAVRRLGKRVALGVEGDLWLVLHLMIAGRLHWKPPLAKIPGKYGLLALDFADGTLLLTEAGSKRRASVHVVPGADLDAHQPGGLEVTTATLAQFAAALQHANHTLKRALTDPHLFSGIGNAYSDEILHRARLSPLRLTRQLDADEVARLHQATVGTLLDWLARLRREAGETFPEKVTAFRDGMAVHGRFGKPCPDCGAPVQRIVHADNETNYCARCQTGGRLLADRAMSRLLHGDWPKHLDDG